MKTQMRKSRLALETSSGTPTPRSRSTERQDYQMAMKNKIELEPQAIKLLGTTTMQTQRLPEKSNEEKQVGHMRSKNRVFHCEPKQNYTQSTEVTALPRSFDWKLKLVHGSLPL
jgi:hypothetical protein